MAPTSWPAGKTLTASRPPDSAVIDCATRSAPDWRPGKPFGQMVTILSSRTPWATAGIGKPEAEATTPAPALVTNWRRSMVSLPAYRQAHFRLLPKAAGRLVDRSSMELLT